MNFISKLKVEFFFIHFLIWQSILILIYLFSRKRDNLNPFFSDQVYLGFLALATFLLAIHIGINLTKVKINKNKLNIVIIFSLPILALYISMFLNFDFRSMQSLTLFVIIFIPFIVLFNEKKDDILFITSITIFSSINSIITLLQIFNILPVAQLNERELLIGSIQRPTGLFFNAFAMSYASLIFLAVGLYFIKTNFVNKRIPIILIVTSLISLILSGTRTSMWLALLFIVVTVIINLNSFNKNSNRSIFWILIVVGAFSPLILLIFGALIGNLEFATLNGRTQMWSCVINKSVELFPFGVGLDDAFPPQYCAESGWFSNLRHPENMFLLAYVESGILGVISYIILFIATLRIAYKKLLNNNYLPLFITLVFLLSSLIYVPLFHYLPFLPNRPADRGIFNFHIMYFIWLYFLNQDYNLEFNKIKNNRNKAKKKSTINRK